jgi:hypothetical protein
MNKTELLQALSLFLTQDSRDLTDLARKSRDLADLVQVCRSGLLNVMSEFEQLMPGGDPETRAALRDSLLANIQAQSDKRLAL